MTWRHGDIMVDNRAFKFIDADNNYTWYKQKFLVNFLVYIYFKRTCDKMEALFALN